MLTDRTHFQFQLTILFVCLSATMIFAQRNRLIDSKSTMIKKYEINESEEGWLYFNNKAHIKQVVNDMFQEKSSFGLQSDDELKLKSGNDLFLYASKNTKWSTGGVLKINQLHKGLRVEATQLSIHYD